jgi:predicted amidohydrolase
MRAAAVQLNSNENKERNLAAADELTRAAASDGAQLVVLPEKFNVLGTHEHYEHGAEPLDGPTITWARETAAELGIDLVAGSIVERREGREKLSNTCVHISPDGDIRAVYRKIHMFDVVVGDIEYKESASEEPGDEIVVSELGDGEPLGLTVCYDLRFPELFRRGLLAGAEAIAIGANWPEARQTHWRALLVARAIENQSFVLGVNRTGRDPNLAYVGGSIALGPKGEVLGELGAEEAVLSVEVDPREVRAWREKFPAWKDAKLLR